MSDFNPYTAPEISRSLDYPDEGRGVWADGPTLVMAKVARLPSRCVKCNAPSTNRLKRTLYWHHPAWYILIFAPGLLVYLIVAIIIRKSVRIEIPLCDQHRARRRKGILIAWVVALLGIGACFSPTSLGEGYDAMILVGIVVIVIGLIIGVSASQVVSPQKIDKTHAWLKKVSPLYLAELPMLPNAYDHASKKPHPLDDEF